MVSAIVRWIKEKLGIAALERENAQLGMAALAQHKRVKDIHNSFVELAECLRKHVDDSEARIAFLEKQLTAKVSEAKIVPKSANWKQFRSAAEKASETEELNG
jgi:hypothetical protein